MKKKINLPEQLKYFEPAMKKLSKIPPDELNEMTNTDLLAKLLLRRIDGLNNQQADILLSEDRNVLEQWIKEDPNHHGAADFIFGFLMGCDTQTMREASQAKPAETVIEVQFPSGFKTERPNDYCINGKKEKFVITVGLIPQTSTYDHLKTRYTTPAPSINVPGGITKEYDQKFSEVNYGKVHGYKVIYLQTTPLYWKTVEYLLEIPGGYAMAGMFNGGKDFNEMEYESFMGTLEIRKNTEG